MNLRTSALEAALESLSPEWGDLQGMRAPLHFGDPESERGHMATLALADLSALTKLGVKGPWAGAFLTGEGIAIPEAVYAAEHLPEAGWVIRVDGDEFFLEEGPEGHTLSRIREALGSSRPGVYRVERQETGILLCGQRAIDVIRQTCGYPFEVEPAGDTEFVYTRMAAVTCSILKHSLCGIPAYRIWCVPSSGRYLWETLLEIGGDLGGSPVGLSCYRKQIDRDRDPGGKDR